MSHERILKQAFNADCRLPEKVFWHAKQGELLHNFLDSAPHCDAQHHQTYSLHAARDAHTAQLQSDISSRATTYNSTKEGYNGEPYIRQCHDRHLRPILAQFRTGSHWLHIETGRHKKLDKNDRTCPICAHKYVNPGLPKHLDGFDSDEEVDQSKHWICLLTPALTHKHILTRKKFHRVWTPDASKCPGSLW